MDIDMRSPSFRTPRSGRTKRPRSPPSPSPYERPNKRISLGGIPAIPFPQPLPSPLPLAPPAVRERQVSEDWVTRTRSLSIENFKFGEDPYMKMAPVVETMSGSQDENMNIDHDDPMNSSETSHKLPPSLPLQGSLSSYSSSLSLSNSLSSSLDTSDSLFSHTFASTTSLQSFPSPVTSSDTTSFPSPQTHSSSNFSSPAQTPAPTSDHIPTPSTPVIARKPRFTMGPRADCEKCRLGVAGHWAHFD